MTRDELEYQGGYMRERMEEIKNEIKDEYLDTRNFDDPMDHYAGYDSTQDTIDDWIEKKAKEYGVSYDLIAEVCNEIDHDELDNASKEYEWANTPGNLTPEEYDAYMMGELNIQDRINSGCHSKNNNKRIESKYEGTSILIDYQNDKADSLVNELDRYCTEHRVQLQIDEINQYIDITIDDFLYEEKSEIENIIRKYTTIKESEYLAGNGRFYRVTLNDNSLQSSVIKSSMTLDKIKALHYPSGWESGTVDVVVVEGNKLGVKDSSYPGYERWIDVDKFDNYSVWDKDGNIWQITRVLWNSKEIKSSIEILPSSEHKDGGLEFNDKTGRYSSDYYGYATISSDELNDFFISFNTRTFDIRIDGFPWNFLMKGDDKLTVEEKDFVKNHYDEIKNLLLKYYNKKPIKSSTNNQSNVSRDDVEKELDRVLVKKHLHLDKNVRDETIDYILSFFDEEYPPKDVKEAVSEWYRDTKKNFPDVFEEGEGKKIASSRYLTYIRSIYVNPRDEYLKMQGRNIHENEMTLSQGEFDDAMDNSGEWIRGYYKWTSDSHNWGRQIDVGITQIVSYSTDSNIVFISIVEDSTKNKLAKDKNYGLNYNEVMDICQKQMDNWYNYMAD